MEQYGGAGHSLQIAKRLSNKGLLIGIDRDKDALSVAQDRLKEFSNVKYVHDNHDNIKEVLENLSIDSTSVKVHTQSTGAKKGL